MGTEKSKIPLNAHVHLRTANQQMSRPERHVDDITDMRRSCRLRENTSGRRPLGSSSRLLKVPAIGSFRWFIAIFPGGMPPPPTHTHTHMKISFAGPAVDINCEQYLFSLSSTDLVSWQDSRMRISWEENSFARTYKHIRRARDSPEGVLAVYRKLYSEDKRDGMKCTKNGKINKTNKETNERKRLCCSLEVFIVTLTFIRHQFWGRGNSGAPTCFSKYWSLSNERNLLKLRALSIC